MTINSDGDFEADSADAILDAMVADFESRFNDNLPEAQSAAIRKVYRPIAERLAEAQQDAGLILASSQIDNATGTALDLLVSLIGVVRRDAQRSSGEATFSRETAAAGDYQIPAGTVVTTDSQVPLEYVTTESGKIAAGDTSTTIPIRSVSGGERYNTGAFSIIRMPSAPAGVEAVTNPEATTGGKDRENDRRLRERAQDELAAGSAATAAAMLSAIKALPDTRTVSLFVNEDSEADADGRPAKSFELVVEGGADQDIIDAIADTKAICDLSIGGVTGDEVSGYFTLDNGQTFSLAFSRPGDLPIYVDMEIDVTSDYAGDSEVMDEVVDYIGGILTSGNTDSGDLGAGDDVIYTEILARVQNVQGVHDIPSLMVGEAENPTGSSNVTVDRTEVANIDATAGDIAITSTEV